METIEKIGSFVWNIIDTISNTITNIISFIKNLGEFIPDFLSFLPTEIKAIFIPLLIILIGIFIYRFVR